MDVLTECLSQLDRAFDGLLLLSFHGSIIVAAVFVLHKFFSRTLSPKWVYTVWMLVLVRFVLVIAPASPVSFQNWIANNNSEIAANDMPTSSIVINTGRWTISDRPVPGGIIKSNVPTAPDFSFRGIMAMVWVTGCMILIWRFARSWMLTQRIIKSAQPAFETIQNVFGEAKEWTEYVGNVDILVTDRIDTPAACGLLWPKVLLPGWCASQLATDELRMVFVHELTHLKKKDVWIQSIAHLVSIAHWFNPLVAFANRKLDAYREMACDQRSLELLAKFNVDKPKIVYGNVILKVATYCSEHSRLPGPLLVGTFVNSDKQQIQQRIAMLVNTKPRKITTSLLAVCLVFLVLVVGFTSAQTAEEPKELPNPVVALPHVDEIQARPVPANEVPVRPRFFATPERYRLLENSTQLLEPIEIIEIEQNENRILEFDEPIPEILVAEPAIVSALPRSSNEIVVCGKSQGFTHMTIVFASGKRKTINIGVAIARPDMVVLDVKIFNLDKAKFSKSAVAFAELAGATKKPDSFASLLTADQFPQTEKGNILIKELSDDAEMLTLLRQVKDDLPGVESIISPKITTIMSLQATLHVGGELPVEQETDDGRFIDFKPYGTIVRITPRPTDDPDQVELQIQSELSKRNGPDAVLLRKFNAGIRLNYGNTLVTVGSYVEDGIEKEVLFMVTPTLVDQP